MAYQGGGGGGVQNLSRQPSQQSLSRPNYRQRPQDDVPHGYRQQDVTPQQSPYPSRHEVQRSQSQHNVYPQQSGQLSRHDSRQDGRQVNAPPPSHHQSQPSMYHPQQQELRTLHHPSALETQSSYMSQRDPGRYGSQQIANPQQSPYPSRHELRHGESHQQIANPQQSPYPSRHELRHGESHQQIANPQQSPYPSRHELRHGESHQSLVRGSRQHLAEPPQDPQNRVERQFTAGPSDQYATVQKPPRDQGPVQRLFDVNHHESHQSMPNRSSQAYQPHPQSGYSHHQSHTSLSPDTRPQGPERGRESYAHQSANQQTGQDGEAPPPYYSPGHSPESSYVPQPDLSPPPQNFIQSHPLHSQPSYLSSQQGLAPSYHGSEQGQPPSEGQYSPTRAESQHIASHLARNESSRTQQSVRSHHSRASSLSNTPPIPEVRGKEASHIIDLLQREIVYITGGRDRNGGPVVTFPGHLPHPEPSQHDIMTCLQYYVQIPSEESKCRGFTAVVDSRDGSWPNMVTVLGCLKKMLGEYIKQVLVIKSDPNIDRKSHSQSFRRDRNNPNLEPHFLSVNRLYEFVDKKELTGMFGGHLSYHHGVWLKNRQDLEKFIRESRAAASHLDTAEAQIQQAYSKKDSSSPLESLRQHRYFQDSIMSVPTQVIRDGRELLSQLRRHRDPPQGQDKDSVWTLDDLEAQKQVKRLIQYIENRVEKLQNYLENRDRTLSLNLQYEDLHRDIKTVVSWILGPGEKLLSSQVDIGDSYETANELRRRHEEMEIKCMDTYGQYAELRYKAEELMEEDHPGRDDIHSVRDYMDTVCRSFASRLERRRTLLITSVRFHRLAEDFSQKLDSLLELLCTETELVDVDTAEKALAELNEKCDSIDLAASQSLADGQSLLDEMSRPIKNASGKDISPDYDTQIKHINKCLEDLQERRMRCDDLADVRKLKLQQILQLRTCERDADQAIAWIQELCEVMLYTHTSMGHTPQEAEVLQEEHKKFESTAEGTYDYGKQLLQAVFVLRRSLRIDLAPNEERMVQLEEAWKRFSEGSNERANRLTVAAMFLTSAEKLFDQVEQLMKPVNQALTGEITAHEVIRHHSGSKEHLENEYNDTNHMGRALLERLSLPIILVDRDNKQVSVDDQGASESIVGKIRKLDRQVQELNQGWEEMQQVRRPAAPQPPQRSSSQRSQTLPRNTSGSMRSNDRLPQKSESMRRRPRQWTSEVDSRSGSSISEGRISDPNQGQKQVKEKMQKLSNAPQESAISRSYAAPVKSQPLHQRSKSTMPGRPGVRTREGDRLHRQLEEGAEWIRVRVHQMEPDLMDVGSTLEEALQYQREHNEMLAKLKAKEDEVKKILCSADSYVTENPSQADVYSAMADTLSEAWRELNKKLEARSLLLEESVEFHKSAHEFSSKMEQAQGKISTSVPTHDVETARHLLQQHQEIKTGILEASKSTLNQGHTLLTRIREMGMHADLQNRHATTAACYGIEHLLELLQDRRRRLEDIWEQRRIRLEQCFQLCQLDMEVNKVLDWYRTVGSSHLQKTELGDSFHQVQLLQEDHYRFETQAKHIQQTVVRLVRDADQLLRRANMDAEGVRRRLQTVDRECEDFRNKLDTRRKNIMMAASFFDQAETALTKLDQVEVQLNSMDLPRNSAALADRHAQLSNAIVEVSTQALREGRILLERVSRDDPGADGVRRRMTLLQERCAGLESLCKARRAEAWERSQAYLQFQEHFNSLQTWLTSIGQSTLSQHADMGTRLETAEDFLEIHEQLDQDLRDKNAELEALFEAGVNLVKSGDQEAQTAAGKVDTLHKQMQKLHRIVEVRIQLSLVYLSFHKLVQQLTTSMSGLEHIMTSETENLQDLTDQAMRHTEEMYNKLNELYNDVQEKGRLFFQNSSAVKDDSTLNIKESVLTVERTITEYSERMTYIKTVWESWQQKVSTSRQFKSQWHQFVQDARKTIDHVLKIENDFFPVIGGELGSSIEAANEFQQRLDEFTPMFESAIEDLDKHLSTAELMEMKGDTKGQKDMIVNELVKVRQRFQARIHEYRILIKMTIQFFRNLDQLDKLIEKTEKEYTQSELPSDLSQAESMLEEHKRKQKEVSSLINFTSGEGEKIVVRVRQTDAEAAAQEDVERVLKVTAEYKQRWNQAWEDQEKRLKQNLQICQFNYDLRQIHSEIDDLHHHLQARRGSYGNSLPAARMTSQAFKQFEMTVQLIEKKIGMFTSTAQVMVQDQHYDAVHIGREIDLLKTKWSTFHTSVGNYRMLLDVSITYFTLIEESEQWIREGNTLLINISRRVPECRNPEEAETLARSLNSFMESGKPRQEDRLKHISELAIELYGDEGPAKVHQLFVTNQDLMMSAQQMDTEIAKVHQNLTQAQMAPPVHEDVVPMEVTVTASAAVAKQPPKITLHLKDAEVMEGEKVTLECQVQSDLPPEVTWYKDNMPLNSPDYETKFNLGRATLTIEETFSEDTARYTCRFTSQTGVAESSSYLHVRALEKPVIHSMSEDVNIPEGKSVKLEIIFSGSPTPEVTWYRNEDRISPSSVYKITIELNRSVLEITEAYTEDSGTYKVTLQNTAGETHRSCQVNVENFYSSAAEEMSIASLEAEPQKPSFVQPLAPAREVMEGSRVRLDCVITGHPEPEVIWFRKDKPVKESKDIQLLFEGDRCTLSIREAYLEDSGLYRCLARNQHGEAESTCKLHVEPLSELSDASCGEVAAPKFTQLLRDLSIPIGHRVCLQCRVTGHPVPDIQWYKDNKLIENSPDYQVTAFADVHNLTIPETFEEDTGNYMVRATNLAGEAKCYAKLSVKAPPEPIQEAEVMRLRRVVETKESNMIVKRDDGLEQSPPEFQKLFQDMTVNAGDNVTFECTITGSPKPKVTWYFNGEPVVSRDYQISMEVNTYRLHIPEVFDEDAGRFSITAENPSGKATCSACLNVDEEPTIPKTRIFGNTEMLSKRVSRTETTMTETHVKHIYQSTQQPDTYIPSYESHSTTILTDVSDAEPVPVIGTTEHYATTIKTDVPPTFKPVDLTIAVPIPPKFLQPLKNITAAEGSKVVFEGVVSGKPEPTIKWFREGKQLTDKADFEIGYRDGRVSLTIPEVFEEDAGRFECQADNEGGQATSSSQLVVRATMIPPKFTEKLKITETREGQAVRFMVRVSGQPPPTVTWYRNGAQIVSSRDFEIVTEGDLHTLYIPEVFQEDGGTFTVTAENPAGHAQCTTELRILAPMEQVPAPVYKPVTAVRETFDQRRAPPREAPKPFEPTEEPSAKVPKLQRPSQFVTRPEPKPQMFSEQIEMQVDSKPRLAPFEKRIELFKEPAPEEEIPPPLPTSKPPVFVTTKEKPVFTQMLKNVSVCEGERVVFECRVSAHPEPIIKWYRETVIITSSPDYEITWDNNTARLTIAEIFPEDAGVFKCVATNAEGSATSEARLVVKPATPEIDVPITEEPIRHVQAPKRDEKVPAMTPIRPQFTDKPGNSRLVEATNTIFECHVTGVPFPEITWKKRGFPLRTDKRHRTTVDPLSGRCSLTISHCRPDDAGEYTCTAVNLAGEDTVTANLLPAEARAPSPPPPPMPSIPVAPLKSWKPVSAEPRETQVPVQEPVTRKPWEPVQVQKQQPVSAPPQTWEPSMTELRARMEAPQRHPQEFVVTRAEKILESNLQYRLSKEPEEKKPPPVQDFQSVGFEQRLMSENYMRDGHIKISSETETSEYESELQDDRGPPAPPASPAIVQKLKDFRLIEGSDATFVCRVTGRPRPKIAWYKNGHRIKRSNRYEMKYTKDGYCTLRIRIALPEDAGHFTILAVNASGKATCSSMLYVDSVGQIDSTSFVAPTTLEKIASKDKAKSQKPEDQSGILEALVRPTFKKIPESLQAREGQTVRLDTVVSGRPAPELTWYRDGQPVRNDNNHKTVVNEDGVNSLIILSSTRYDAGTYMCVAKSKAGENSFNVIVSILEKEMLQPPKFLNRMPNVTAKAGEPITLTCDVSGTPTPMISWQKDGKMLVPSNPYRIDIEGNRSTLYIERCEPSDSAWFQCSAINVAGSASTRAKIQVPVEMPKPEPVKKFTVPKVTSPAQVAPKPSQVVPKVAPQVQTKPVRMPGSQSPPADDQHESAVREYIRREGEAPAQEDIYDKHKPKKPWFKTQIKNLMGLKENDSAHFECKLLPLGDPTMEIEWFKDGKPLHHGHRFKHMHDFGFVCLDILYTYPEDSGEYSCTARNSQGEATTTALLKCRGRRSIIMDTQLPGEGAMRLQEMEEYWRSNMYLEERTVDEPRERFPPSIDLKPEPVETGEGEVAKFMIKVSGYPRPRVNWWVNGTVIIGSTRFKLRYDGMIHHLEIPRVREYDGGQIRVVAKNTEGEAEASTTLNVVPKEDWRSRLRQAPKGELEIELERRRKIEMRSVELVTAMEKPKPTTVELKQIERAAEKRVVMRQEKEVMNAEQLYMSVASKPTMRELPARVVRADRPEIQVDIQKARMVPVIPEQTVPDESKISETQIVLERREPPVFTKPLRPVRVTEGNPVTLEVQFKGHPAPIISWYRDSFEIKPSHDFQISVSETVSTLFIPEVFPEDTGMYMVKAYNMYGTVQCKAKMTVIQEESPERDIPPEFRSLIRDSNVVQGEPATFDCQVSGRPKPKIHWQKDGKPLSESPRWKFIEEDNNFTMVIYEVVPEDVGQYDCVAINTVGKATCTARLNVEVPIKPSETEEQKLAEAPVEPPVVTERPQNLEVDEGEPVTFTSRITGSPPPNVTWYRNNVIIKPSKYFRMESTLDGTHSLSILEAFPEDTGLYRCVARNKAGEVTCSATLKVHALESEAEAPVPAQKDTPPQFTKPISNTLVVEGSSATFEAEYSGTPEPTITWLRNSLQVLQDSTNYKIERTTTKTILTIREARPEDSGLITCRIKNIAGTTECSAELYVQEMTPHVDEEEKVMPVTEETVETVEGLPTVQETVAPETTETTSLEIAVAGTSPTETEEVSFEFVTREKAEATPEEVTTESIVALPEQQDVPLTAAVQEVSEVVTTETKMEIGQETQPEEATPEEVTVKELPLPKEEVPVVETAPDVVEEVIEEEAAPTKPTGEAPRFTTELSNITVTESAPVKFICIVIGIPRPKVTWLLDGEKIEDSETYITEFQQDGTCTLTIDESFKEDEGEYSCMAENDFGTAMTTAVLQLTAPEEKLEESVAEVTIDVATKVEETKEEIEAELTIEQVLSEKEKLVTAEEEKDAVSEEEKSPAPDEVVKPKSPELVTAEILEERTAPEIVKQLTDVLSKDGGSARFECIVEGHPRPEVTWYKDEESLTTCEEFTISYEDNLTVLEIPDVYVEDGGKYTVVAKNELGTATTSAELIVEVPAEEIITGIPPYFDKKPKFQNVETGSDVHFEAVVRALPQPDIMWTREGVVITSSDKYTVEMSPLPEENTYHTSLTLNQVTVGDAGTYKITASNEEGDANVSVSLLVRDEGPKTTDFRDSLKKEVKTRVGIKHAPAQKDFRDNLKTEVHTKQGVSYGAEQLDFRDSLKSKVKTKVGTTFKAEQVDYRDALQHQVKTKVGEKFETEQVDYRDALQKQVQTKVGTSFAMEQVDYRDALQRQVDTKVGTVYESEQVDYRDALQREVKTKVGVTYESEQVDYRDALQNKVTTKVGTADYQAEQLDFRQVLRKETVEETKEVLTAEQVDFREVLHYVELVAPRFETRIESVVAKEGEPVKFFVKVTGKPTPTISWHHDDQVLTTDEIYRVTEGEEGESTLELPEVFPEDTGRYTVKAVNEAGEAVATATLTVTEEVTQEEIFSTTEVIQQEVIQTVESEQVVSVEETIETADVTKTQVDVSADLVTEEQVSEIQKVDDLVAPAVTVESEKMVAKEGEPVQFIARASGSPAPTLQWYYGTEPINTDEIYKVTESKEGESILELAEVFPEDAGEYTIKAVNGAGEAVATTTLDIIEYAEEQPEKPVEVSVELSSEESSHAFPDTQYEVGTKVFTWHLRSGETQDASDLPTTTLLKEEVEVVGDDEEFYEAEESVPQFSFEAKVDTDEESEDEKPEYTFSADYSIDSQIVKGKEPEEEFTFVLKEDVPERSPEKDVDETDEFTFVTKDEIPKLDLPQSSSDEEEEIQRPKPVLDDDVSISSSEEYLSDEEVVISSASSDSEPETDKEQPKVSMPDVVPKQKEPIKVYPTSSSSSTSEEEEEEEVKDQTYGATVFVEEKLQPDHAPVEEAMVPVDEPFMSSFEIVSKNEYMSRQGIMEPDGVTFEAKLDDKEVKQPSTAEEAVFTLKTDEEDEPSAPHTDHDLDIRLEADEEPREDVVVQMYMDKKSDDEELLEEFTISGPKDKREEILFEEKQPDVSVEELLEEQDQELDQRPEFSFEAEIQEERLDNEDIAEVSYEIEVSEPRESDASFDDHPLNVVMTVDTEVSLPSDISSEGIEEDEELYEDIEEFQGTTVSVLETVPEESSLEESRSADVTPEVDQDVSFSFSLDDGPKDEVQESFSISEVKTVESVEVEVTIPRFMRELSDQEVTEGDTVTFIVEVLGSPFPDISWFKDGVEITPDDHFQMEVRGNFASLIVKDVVTNDDAEYVVKATNEAGTASSMGELFVNPSGEAPTFVIRLEDQTIELGSPLKLECQVKGHPKPKVTWLKDGEEITDERYTIEFIEETVTLQIAESVPADEGDYSVKAVNDRGAATCNAEVLINLEAPKFTKPLSNVSVDIDHIAVLECTVIGKPTPKITWLADQTVIEESVKYHASFHDNVATLEVTSVTEEDGDVVYTCKAENVAGDTSCSAQLTVQGIFV